MRGDNDGPGRRADQLGQCVRLSGEGRQRVSIENDGRTRFLRAGTRRQHRLDERARRFADPGARPERNGVEARIREPVRSSCAVSQGLTMMAVRCIA